ncbi:MAG: aminotransferase class I/II-fold pyridoxal phosphate-dependent enzyme [Alphaproteobacteria bacterium]|nr:aminotransferase class I/II-fold pyridoxal phosphate-dependent enzyme [Alphaproteobacteria bacterium]MDD9919134.1 aminotransferase class I/II-fold pyridoxal phosphate-dependent enzyme [Alphaproteobacteria bacterium]
MNQFSARMDTIKPSPVVVISNEVRKMRAAGEKVFSFSIGVPGFLPPEHVYKAAENAAKRDSDGGAYLSSRGVPELVEAFLHRLEEDGFSGYTEKEVCAQMGGKGALFNLLLALAGPGKEVIYPAPYWTSYDDLVTLSGATPKPIYCSADQNYKLTGAQLEAAITPNTQVFMFNNPSNPTGMVYTEEEVKEIAAVLKKYPHVWVISDDIYDKLIYDGQKFHHLLDAEPTLKDRLAIVQSVSKSYGMPCWRVGMVAAPEALINQLLTLVGQTLFHLPAVPQMAAAAAFGGDHSFLNVVKNDFVQNRNTTMDALNSLNNIQCCQPSGAFYAFPNISACLGKNDINNDVEFCQKLLQEQQVACIPGSAFGDPNAIRISYATDADTLRQGLQRLCDFVEKLS